MCCDAYSNRNDILNSSIVKVDQLHDVNSDYKKITVLSDDYQNDNAIKVQSIEEDANISKARELINSSENSISNTLAFEEVNDDKILYEKRNELELGDNVKNYTDIMHDVHSSDISKVQENGSVILKSQKSFENVTNLSQCFGEFQQP